MIIVRIWEGLGNQMFQYAYAMSLREKGIDVRIDLDKSYDSMFGKYRGNEIRENSIQNFKISISSINMKCYKKYEYLYRDTWKKKVIFWLQNHLLWKYKFYEEEEPGFSKKVAELKGNYYIKGWFQNEEYFKNIRSIILKEFLPKKKIKISKELKKALQDQESVSMHIRRGDFLRIGLVLNATYYEKAIDYVKNIYRNPIILIFSDDLEWVKKNIHLSGKYIFVNEKRKLKDYEELFIMSRCKANIISNSTFSWWGAWLNQNQDKIVVAPRKWNNGQENIVPEDWITL